MKSGIRTPSLRKRIAARTSWKRYVRHSLGVKAPRGWGWLTNPKRAAYNRVYSRTTVSVDRLLKSGRRRGSRHDGSALLLVVGVIVAAAFGVYLLAAAALVLVAWLVRVATKKPSASAPDAQTTSVPRPPDAEYQPVASVDPNVFGDFDQARGAASVVFDAWLQHIPKAPRHGADLVRSIDVRRRLIGRMTTELVGRRFAWRATPINGRQAIGRPPLDPSTLDPWNPPSDLKTASRYIATCWTCDGEGRLVCTACTGAARTVCTSCSGAGKYYGTAANGSQRLLNCKTCRGKGNVVCDACTRGAVDCSTCRKAKKLESWLEIDQSSRQDVQIEPDDELTKVFSWGQDGVLASPDQIAMDAKVIDAIERPRTLALNDLPASVPTDWRTDLWPKIQAKIQPGERVKSQTFTLLDVPSTAVTYAVFGETEGVAFEGLRMLAPPPWSEALLTRRAAILGRAKLVLAALPIAATLIYGARGSYFVGDRAGGLVVGVVVAAAVSAVCAYRVLWSATLGRKTAVKWALAAITPIIIATVLAVLAEPTTARARGYVDAGQLAAAKIELDALGSASDRNLAPLWADIYLKESLAARTCSVAAERANKIASGLPQRAQAITHADLLALTTARQSLQIGEIEVSASALDCASMATRDSAEGRTLRAQVAIASARRCLVSKDWDCTLTRLNDAGKLGATSDADAIGTQAIAAIQADVDAGIASARSEKDLGRRVQLEGTTLALWTSYLAARSTKEPEQIALLKTAKARDEQALARQVEAERQRAAAQEKKRLADEERDRKRQEAAAKAEERGSRPVELYCNDGTISGCGCARSSFQGCCSHHSGVDGCHQ